MVNKVAKNTARFAIDDKSAAILGLFTSDYAKRLHVREIARQLHMNHRTVILHLRPLEQENILTAERIGRTKSYTPNLKNILTKCALELAENHATVTFLAEHFLIKNILAELEARARPEGALILFGSHAKGYATDESDIDLLMIGTLDKRVLEDIKTRTGKRISIQMLTAKDFTQALATKDALAWEVVTAHKILKQSGLLVDIIWRHYYAR